MKHSIRYAVTAGMGAFALCSLTIASLGQPVMYYVILAMGCPAIGLLCAYVGQEDGA